MLDIEFVHDKPGQKGRTNGVAESILKQINEAKESVVIYAPYTFFSKRFMDAIDGAIQRGVKISLVLPSWSSIDTPITLQLFEKQAKALSRKGLEILQHTGDDFMHGKMMIVDRKSVFVGSYNFNRRSELNDYESGVIIRDKEFAADVVKFDESFRSSQALNFKESKKSLLKGMGIRILLFLSNIIPFLGQQL